MRQLFLKGSLVLVSIMLTLTFTTCIEGQFDGELIFYLDAGIANIMIGSKAGSLNPSTNVGNVNISLVTILPYELPSTDGTGIISLKLDRKNSEQVISWAKVDAGFPVPQDSDFTVFSAPASGNTLLATISNNGMVQGERVYIKVVAADQKRTIYYGFDIGVGNFAELESLMIGDMKIEYLGEPGETWDYLGATGVFDFQDDIPPGFTLAATAKDFGTLEYGIHYTDNSIQPAFGPLINGMLVELADGLSLWIRVTSVSTNVTLYYKINLYFKAAATVLYGQPEITMGEDGEEPELDPLWNDGDWDTDYVFDLNRLNMNEVFPPNFKFMNTTVGKYDETGFGHTSGKVKAFWDDGGLYIYAKMTYLGFYEENATAPATVKERLTVVTPAISEVPDAQARLYDSLEVFTNERLQQYTQGNYGIQYRVAPSPATSAVTLTRVSGNEGSGAGGALEAMRTSAKYYTWIRKNNYGIEQGYSIIAYIPWKFKADANANQVFGGDGKVKTVGDNNGPTIGAELRLSAATINTEYYMDHTPFTLDAILAWNSILGPSVQEVKNYGKIKLITGDLVARGITRP